MRRDHNRHFMQAAFHSFRVAVARAWRNFVLHCLSKMAVTRVWDTSSVSKWLWLEFGAFLAFQSGCGSSLGHWRPTNVRQMRATATRGHRKCTRLEPQTIFEANVGFLPPFGPIFADYCGTPLGERNVREMLRKSRCGSSVARFWVFEVAVARVWRRYCFSKWLWLEFGSIPPFQSGCGSSLEHLRLANVR